MDLVQQTLLEALDTQESLWSAWLRARHASPAERELASLKLRLVEDARQSLTLNSEENHAAA